MHVCVTQVSVCSFEFNWLFTDIWTTFHFIISRRKCSRKQDIKCGAQPPQCDQGGCSYEALLKCCCCLIRCTHVKKRLQLFSSYTLLINIWVGSCPYSCFSLVSFYGTHSIHWLVILPFWMKSFEQQLVLLLDKLSFPSRQLNKPVFSELNAQHQQLV